MEEIARPVPVVFRVRTTNSMLLTGCVTAYLCFFFTSIVWISLSKSTDSQKPVTLGFTIILAATAFTAAMLHFHRKNNTQARIEISGNTITQFDEAGAEILTDDLNEIAIIYESHCPSRNRRDFVEYYHVQFLSGSLLTFNQLLENDFTLKKKLKVRTQSDFHRISWEGSQLMEIEKKESRAVKAKRIKKPANKEFWDPSGKDY